MENQRQLPLNEVAVKIAITGLVKQAHVSSKKAEKLLKKLITQAADLHHVCPCGSYFVPNSITIQSPSRGTNFATNECYICLSCGEVYSRQFIEEIERKLREGELTHEALSGAMELFLKHGGLPSESQIIP